MKLEDIRDRFEELRDENEARHMSAYMRNQFRNYGIRTPQRRAIYASFLREARRSGTIDRELIDRCWDDEHREFQYFVTDYLDAMKDVLTYDDVPWMERFVRTKQWWDTIDALDRIIGSIAFRDPRINDLMLRWSTDEDFWVRRVAIDHQLLRKEHTDTELLERIITNNLGSKEFFINKAIGWSLRDYSKTNPGWVRAFIAKYRDRMNALSIREASKYI